MQPQKLIRFLSGIFFIASSVYILYIPSLPASSIGLTSEFIYFDNLLKEKNLALIIDELNSSSLIIEPGLRSFFLALSYDQLEKSRKAKIYATHYLENFSQQDVLQTLRILEVVLRNNFILGDKDDFQYRIGYSDLQLLKQDEYPVWRSLIHYAFLDKKSFEIFDIADKDLSQAVEYKLYEKLETIENTALIRYLVRLLEEGPAQIEGYSYLIEKYLANNEIGNANLAIKELALITGSDSFPVKHAVSNFFRKIDASPLKIGMILPLRYSQYKYITDYLRASFYYGLKKFNLTKDDVTLVLADPGYSLEDIDQAYKFLQEKGVSLILGPITRVASQSLGLKAQEVGIPYISYSLSLNANDLPDEAFRFQRSEAAEIEQIVNFGFDALCSRKAVVFYDSKTEDLKEKIVQIFENLGGQIVNSFLVEDVRGLLPIFDDIVDSPVYKAGNQSLQKIEDLQSEDILSLDTVFNVLPSSSLKFILNYMQVYSLNELHVLGLGDLYNAKENYNRYEINDIWIASSNYNNQANNDLLADIWKNNSNTSEFYATNDYVVYGYLSSLLIADSLKKSGFVGKTGLSAYLKTIKKLSTPLGTLSYKDKEIVLQPKIAKYKRAGFAIESDYLSSEWNKSPNCFQKN